jgi:PAS domain S-box-containing protein
VLECLVVVDGQRCVRSANRAFYEKFGSSASAAVGRRLSELGAGPWMEPGVERLLAALAAGESSSEGRVEVSGKDAEPSAFLVSAVRLPGGPHIRLSFIDITERELARKALERSEAEFFDVLATAAVGIVITDTSGHIVFANAELGRIFGYAAHELVGQSVDVLVPERFAPGHARLREKYHSESLRRRMGSDRELVGRRKDGSDVAIEVTLSPLARDRGPLVVSFVTDVTEARDGRRKILLYQDKLQQLAFEAALSAEGERRRIANDLHDRVGQALSFAEMRLKSARGSDGAKDAAMDEAIALLARTSEDVRTLVVELSPPILYDLGLEAAVAWLADDLRHRMGIAVEVDSDETPTPLPDTAAGVAFRAVRELLTNVIKHAQVPAARVSIRRSDGRLIIRVEDRGVGFDVDALGLDTDRSRFGLFSVREQLRRLGGTLKIDSIRRHGTCVSLELPLVTNGGGAEGAMDTGVHESAAPVQD